MNGEEIWHLVKPDVKALAEKLLIAIVMPALDKVIAESKTPIDDAVWAVAKPTILIAIKDQLAHI